MEILNNITRIIAYGCSYTGGDELLDHEVLGMPFDHCNKFKQQFKNPLDFYNLTNNGKTISELLESDGRNRNASWAGQLAKLLGKDFENNAVNGSSTDEHFYKILVDISNKKILETDLVLVGLSIPDRIFIFPTNADKPYSKLLGWKRGWDDNPDYQKAATEYFFTDFSLILNYYKNIKLLTTLNDKINIRLQPMRSSVIPSHSQFLYKSDIKEINDYVASVWDDCQDFMLYPAEGLTHDRTQRCGFGHPTFAHHTQLVEKISTNLRNTIIS